MKRYWIDAAEYGGLSAILNIPFAQAHGFDMMLDRIQSELEEEKKAEYLRSGLVQHETIKKLKMLLSGDPISISLLKNSVLRKYALYLSLKMRILCF